MDKWIHDVPLIMTLKIINIVNDKCIYSSMLELAEVLKVKHMSGLFKFLTKKTKLVLGNIKDNEKC